MSNATIERLEKINAVYAQTIREQDERIAALEAQLAAAEAELAEIDNALWASMGDEKYDRAKRVNFLLREGSLKHQAEQQLAAAQEREEALRAGFTACIDTLWRYARIAARERGESETSQLMSANEAVGHFRAALNAAKGE